MSTRSSRPPSFDADPFATEFLDDPYPHYERLREAGAMVYLPRYQCHAVGRHAEVERVLGEWETFSSAAGVGLANFNKEKPWRPPSLVLEADPPLHTRTRTVLTRVLSPGNIRKLGERFEREASMLIDRVVDMRSFDGVRDLAEPYPVKVFPDAVGLRHDGREHLLPYGNMVFNSFGPRNALTEAAFANAEGVRAWIMANCARDALAADGLGAEIYAAVDRGELSAEEAPTLVRSFLSAGVDTTVNALGNALWCFAQFPDQWDKLRGNPSGGRGAFEEVLRYEAPVQVFFRTTTREADLGGKRIGAGEKVAAFMGSANRDPRRWPNPDIFDISRRAAGHMSFGVGIHGCVGQAVARLEGSAVLGALIRKVARIEINGEPKRRYNNILRSFQSLPLRIVPA